MQLKNINSLSSRLKDILDEDFLYQLYSYSREEELIHLTCSPKQKEHFLRSQFTARNLHYKNTYPNALHHIITFNTLDIGSLQYFESKKEIRLIDIAILPRFQNSGIGSSLLNELIKYSKEQNKKVTLHVSTQNTKAIKLYKNLGFSITSEDMLYIFLSL